MLLSSFLLNCSRSNRPFRKRSHLEIKACQVTSCYGVKKLQIERSIFSQFIQQPHFMKLYERALKIYFGNKYSFPQIRGCRKSSRNCATTARKKMKTSKLSKSGRKHVHQKDNVFVQKGKRKLMFKRVKTVDPISSTVWVLLYSVIINL